MDSLFRPALQAIPHLMDCQQLVSISIGEPSRSLRSAEPSVHRYDECFSREFMRDCSTWTQKAGPGATESEQIPTCISTALSTESRAGYWSMRAPKSSR